MNGPMSGSFDDALLPRGTGPVATVHRTAPSTGGQANALKVFPGPLDRATVAELLDEQRTLAGLRNVSSILLIDGLEELPDGRAAIRMELCARSLAEVVEVGGPLPLPEVVELVETIAGVLVDAHAANLVHGGVTPTNVLYRSAGQPVLADFGLGLRQCFPRAPEAAAAYTAPEVLRGAEPAEPADLYGLGAVLYVALTGKAPFSPRPGEPAGEVLLRALGETPAALDRELPVALSDLVTTLLAKDPAERPGSASDVLDRSRELHTPAAPSPAPEQPAALSTPSSPSPVRPDSRSERSGIRGWTRPLLLAGPAVLAVLAVLLGVVGSGAGGTPGSAEQDDGASKAAGPTARRSDTPDPAPPSTAPQAAPSVEVEIQRIRDHGSTVDLTWRSSKPLTYAVFVAEQGAGSASANYRGTGTTLTVPVQPDLKYCFQVQGTNGTRTFQSRPRGIRGATCRS